jgi:hypothetical protein
MAPDDPQVGDRTVRRLPKVTFFKRWWCHGLQNKSVLWGRSNLRSHDARMSRIAFQSGDYLRASSLLKVAALRSRPAKGLRAWL